MIYGCVQRPARNAVVGEGRDGYKTAGRRGGWRGGEEEEKVNTFHPSVWDEQMGKKITIREINSFGGGCNGSRNSRCKKERKMEHKKDKDEAKGGKGKVKGGKG